MLLRDQVHPATCSACIHAPLHHPAPFLPESRRRIRPLSPFTHPAFLPPNHAFPNSPCATSRTALHSYSLTAAAAAVTPTPSSFLRLAIVFVAGGLFFSSAVAAATASYAIGMDNIQRFRGMAKVVWEGVWVTFTMGLSATKEVLCGSSVYGDYWNDHSEQRPSLRRRYQAAWRVLRCKLGETRRKAVEGVQALQREVKLCAAAVGAPGLIPLQYMLDRQLHFTIAGGIEGALEQGVGQLQIPNVDLKLSHFETGTVAPKLESARVYDLGDHAMAFDYDVTWESELEATIQVQNSYLPGTKVPVTLHNVHFRGPVRVVMAPLTAEFPGFGATLVSFPSMPEIGMDVRVAGGEVTKVVPMVRAELLAAIERSIEESMIWPKRAVIPSYPMDDPTTPILSAKELKDLEITDPLLEAEEALGTRPVLRRKMNQISNLLYNDQHNEDLLKDIVDLPMPSFQADKKVKTPPQHTTTLTVASKSTIKPGGGEVLEQLQKFHQMGGRRSPQCRCGQDASIDKGECHWVVASHAKDTTASPGEAQRVSLHIAMIG